MTKLQRFSLSPTDKDKLLHKACASLKTKFALMNYEKLLDGATEKKDLGQMLLAQATTRSEFIKWTGMYDMKSIFMMPDVNDFSDPRAVASAPKVDLLKNYRGIQVEKVRMWQSVINLQLSDADKESSCWVHQKLENSIEATLLVQLKQNVDRRPTDQQGGITLWFTLALSLDASDHENKKLVTAYLSSHRLTDTKGEDVGVASSCYKAAVRSIKLCDVPSDVIETYLKSMATASNEDFRGVVKALLGNFHAFSSPGDIASDLLDKLDMFTDKLEGKYRTMLKAKEWEAAAVMDTGGFKASISPPNNKVAVTPNKDGLVPPDPTWQAWFDRQTCETCGKRHPTKYHDDPSIRNRWYKPIVRPPRGAFRPPSRFSKSASHPGTSTNNANRRRQVSFKNPTAKKDFQKRVHKALLETVDDVDEELVALMVGADYLGSVDAEVDEEEPELYANVADIEADDDTEPDQHANAEHMAHTLAVQGLASLNY
jgi:hypothetical protein